MDYQQLYHIMFNAATDALRCLELEDVFAAQRLLIQAQQECEERYIKATEPQ